MYLLSYLYVHSMDTYYDVLGCDKNATYEELKRSYQNLVRIHHPDRRPQDAGFSNNTFMKIDEAWKVLKDPDRRKHYDSELKNANLSEQPMVYETLNVADLKANSSYSYACRCGGMIVIEHSEVDVDDSFVSCENCSLVICVKGSSKRTD